MNLDRILLNQVFYGAKIFKNPLTNGQVSGITQLSGEGRPIAKCEIARRVLCFCEGVLRFNSDSSNETSGVRRF